MGKTNINAIVQTIECSNVNEWLCTLMFVYIVSNDFHDGVNGLNVSANESIFSSFVCRMTHMNI